MGRPKQDLTVKAAREKGITASIETRRQILAEKEAQKPVVKQKGRPKGSKSQPKPVKPKSYKCFACGKESDRADFLIRSYSELYRNNDYHPPICIDCANQLYEDLRQDLGYTDYRDIYQHACMILDLYYNQSSADAAFRETRNGSPMGKYLQKIGLSQNRGKTYRDTVKERINKQEFVFATTKEELEIKEEVDQIPNDIREFWGDGFLPSEYHYLQTQYDDWADGTSIENINERKIIQKICYVELQIFKAMQSGEDTSKLMSQFNNLMESAKLQPKQSKEDLLNDRLSFSAMIEQWEYTRPIPETAPEFQDVDGIVKYVSVWFLGHLCKMLGIKNKWAKMYETELAKYTVDRPELAEEDDEEKVFESIFGDDSGGDINDQ